MTPKTANLIEIGILIYPEALLSAVYGLTDLFSIAVHMAAKHDGLQRPSFRISHWQRNDKGQIACVFDTHPQFENQPVILVSPPSMGQPIAPDVAKPYAEWLSAAHAKGATLCSVCAGAFLIAETGLLDTRRATTHWAYSDQLTKSFPRIKVDADKLVIDDGDIITAGGMMSWIDLGLRLVHRVMGPTIMIETSRFMLVDPPGREQRYYSSFIPVLTHGDAAILKVQHWLQTNGARQVSVTDMAAEARLGERTFLRRFHKATGMKPTEYCQHLRVGKAREMLEFTSQTIEQISWAIGYEDAGAFRKVFFKVMGLAPADYRHRFSMSAI